MPLTFLCAGCSPEERDAAEASVKAALGERARHEAWVVSIVKAGANWSVTLDGPELKGLSFLAAEPALSDSIRERLAPAAGSASAVAAAGTAVAAPGRPSAASMPASFATAQRDRHECRSCRRAFLVIYEVEDGEDQEMVSIACPNCWQLNHVLIAEAAAYTQAFKAERLQP